MSQEQAHVPYRVVIAEDNEMIRRLIVEQIVELGHRVAGTARDGAEVVEVVRRERPDVVVIDRGLPVQDGLAASRAIAAETPTAVVLLSAYMSGGNPEIEALDAGAHAFLAKPHLIEELEEAIGHAIRRFRRIQH